jgi:hypothetical protein
MKRIELFSVNLKCLHNFQAFPNATRISNSPLYIVTEYQEISARLFQSYDSTGRVRAEPAGNCVALQPPLFCSSASLHSIYPCSHVVTADPLLNSLLFRINDGVSYYTWSLTITDISIHPTFNIA